MKKTLVSVLIFLGTVGVMLGQAGDTDKYYFRDYKPSILNKKVDNGLIADHYLGDDIAFKMHVLKVLYTYILTDNQGITKTVVRKPAIFHSIKKLNLTYKRQLKKGEITEQDARKKLDNSLNIGIAIFAQETDNIESVLRLSRDQASIEDVFARVVLQ